MRNNTRQSKEVHKCIVMVVFGNVYKCLVVLFWCMSLEGITGGGVEVLINRGSVERVVSERVVEVVRFEDLEPGNMRDPWGGLIRIFEGDGVGIDVSKNRYPLPFWHRNLDYDEVIIVVKGWIKWATDLGEYTLKAGDMMLIPRGIAHRVLEASNDYEAIEIKSKTPLRKVMRELIVVKKP